jgi:bacterial/archaeal transporter family protein
VHPITAAWAFLAIRVVLLGLERPLGKRVVVGYSPFAGGFAFYGAAMVALIPTLVIYAHFHALTSWLFLPYAAVSASLFITPFYYYIKALKHGEVSVVTPLYSLGTLLVFFLPILLQGEAFTLLKFAGVLLLLAGTLFLMPGINPIARMNNLLKDKGARFMLVNTALVAIIRLIDNRAADFDPIYYGITCAMLCGVFFGLGVLITKTWGEVWNLYKARKAVVWANGIVNGHAYVALLASLGAGLDMSVAEPASNMSMLIAVVLGHYMFREKIRARLLASVLMIAGVFLLVRG